jgi:hypothetical protein
VAEGERSQERAQRRGRIPTIENLAHAAMAQQGQVIDAVRTGDHPRDQRGHLQPGVGALVGGHTQMLIGQRPQPSLLSQRNDRHQATGRHEIRIVEHR